MNRLTSAALLALTLAACAPAPQRAGIPTTWQPSPNHDARRPSYVILHHTGSATTERGLQVLSDPAKAVSAHYLIAQDGIIYQLVDERARAWHAGASRWGLVSDVNSLSIGVELVNDGEQPYPEAQVTALLALLADLRQRYQIPAANFLGHADVAPRRKPIPDPTSRGAPSRRRDSGCGATRPFRRRRHASTAWRRCGPWAMTSRTRTQRSVPSGCITRRTICRRTSPRSRRACSTACC